MNNLIQRVVFGICVLAAPGSTFATVINVTTTTDRLANDGACSLREAIISANKDTASGASHGECPPGNLADEIILPAGRYRLSIEGSGENSSKTGDLDIASGDLTVSGVGKERTVIDGSELDRIFDIRDQGLAIILRDLSVINGAAIGSGSSGDGGGISNRGFLTIESAIVSDNSAERHGGGIYNDGNSNLEITGSLVTGNEAGFDGAGIYIAGAGFFQIRGTTLGDNHALDDGGGLHNNATGDVEMSNATISGNSAAHDGGGINFRGGSLRLLHVTITDNDARNDEDLDSRGGGIAQRAGEVRVQASILSGNRARQNPDCHGAIISEDFNIIGTAADCSVSGTIGNNSSGSAGLGPLQDNGGGQLTHLPNPTSRAVDMADPAGTSCPAVDQLDVARPIDGDSDGLARCDIGAVEFDPAAATHTPTSSPTETPTTIPSGTVTSTTTATSTATAIAPATATASATESATPDGTPSTPTETATPSPTPDVTGDTATPTTSATATETPTQTASATPTSAGSLPGEVCFTVGQTQSLVSSFQQSNGEEIGIGTLEAGVVRALTFGGLGTPELFASDGDALGSIDLRALSFLPIGEGFGSGNGNAGTVVFDSVSGLSYDSDNDRLLGLQQRADAPDLLLVVDPETGSHVASPFPGSTDDYIVLDGENCSEELTSISNAPGTEQLFASDGSRLLRIDLESGDCENIGNFGREVTSLSFAEGAQLFGLTNSGAVLQIDQENAVATEISKLSLDTSYFGLACPPAACSPILRLQQSSVATQSDRMSLRLFWINPCTGPAIPSATIDVTFPEALMIQSTSVSNAVINHADNSLSLDLGNLSKGPGGSMRILAQVSALASTATPLQLAASLSDGFGRRVSTGLGVRIRESRESDAPTLIMKARRHSRPGRLVTFTAFYRNVPEGNGLIMRLPDGVSLDRVHPSANLVGNTLNWQDVPAPKGKVKAWFRIDSTLDVPNLLSAKSTLNAAGLSESSSASIRVFGNAPETTGSCTDTSMILMSATRQAAAGTVTQVSMRYRELQDTTTLKMILSTGLSVDSTLPQAQVDGDTLSWSVRPGDGTVRARLLVDRNLPTNTLLSVRGIQGVEAGAKCTIAVR